MVDDSIMMRFKKIVEDLYDNLKIRVVVLATVSSVLAFLVGSAIPNFISPVIASIVALTAIKSSFYDTVRETFKQIIGTIIGASFGIVLISFVGFNIYSLMLIVIVSMVIGFVLRLEASGGLFIAGTVILIAGPLLGDLQLIEERVGGVVLGALFALGVSMFLVPSDSHHVVLINVLKVGEDSAVILGKISKNLKNDTLKKSSVNKWLYETENLKDYMGGVIVELNGLYKDSRWSPRSSREEVEGVMRQADIVYSNVKNIRTILFSVDAALNKNVNISSQIRVSLAKMLDDARAGIVEQLKNAEQQPRALISNDTVNRIRARRNKVASELKVSDDTQAILLGSTLIHEANKIKNILSDD
jgi:uncharacterized membrane protein YgaE (UPF0421/DUF939 family)